MAPSRRQHLARRRPGRFRSARRRISAVAGTLRVWSERFHRDETGKVTLVAGIIMLAMAVLAGLIGNAGHTVNQKMETQNAADAAAFSSSLWMARGMNAVTATNHMLGEATALAVIHEAIGGPELDLKIEVNTPENRRLDQIIDATRNTASVGSPVPSPYGFTPQPIRAIDKRIVDFVTNQTTPRSGPRTLQAFATIYDSKMTLKRELAVLLPVKSYANIGFLVPPPWGYATAAVAYGVHIYATSQIVLIGKEWVILDVLEETAALLTPLKRDVIEGQLIPTLVAHADLVAGYQRGAAADELDEGIINSAIQRTVQDLTQRHRVETALFPAAEDLRLPVQPEPEPNLQGPSGPLPAGWGSDAVAPASLASTEFDSLLNRLSNTKQRMRRRIRRLREDIQQLDRFEQFIDQLLEDDLLSEEDRRKLEAEKAGPGVPPDTAGSIAQSRRDKQTKLARVEQALQDLEDNQQRQAAALNQPSPTTSDNPSIGSIPQRMDAEQERVTQWVRATYPYVDSFRAALGSFRAPLAGMSASSQGWLPKSKAAEHFAKWSNRYALVKAWQFRSGYRAQKSSSRVTWSKKQQPLSLLVMRDAYQQSRQRKGREPWTRATPAGKRQAEQYFTLVGFAHRQFQPLFSTVVYPAPSEHGMTAYAQAVLYNANPQEPSGDTGRWQARLGWDTLNWDPDTPVPDWGGPPSQAAPQWPWEIFSGSAQNVKVKLNWQAKLMPVTTSRLRDSEQDIDGPMGENIQHAVKYFDELGRH
jgi:hypothetical protein